MNENIDLTKILKNCPKGTKLYTPIWGEVVFSEVRKNKNYLYPICINTDIDGYVCLTKDGRYLINKEELECILFPSKDQRDWSKFTAPWYKVKKFNPKTLKPFDKVIVRYDNFKWKVDLFSHYETVLNAHYKCISDYYKYCIPYNNDTKHLVGTTEEAPDFYKYWEE